MVAEVCKHAIICSFTRNTSYYYMKKVISVKAYHFLIIKFKWCEYIRCLFFFLKNVIKLLTACNKKRLALSLF